MSPIRRGGIFYLYVPRVTGSGPLRTTQTTDKVVYNGMKRMLADLKARRKWSLLNAIIDGTQTMGQVYDAHVAGKMDELEDSLSAQALAPLVTDYLAVLKGRGKDERHIQNVKQQLDQFLVKHETTADLTNAKVTAWLSTLTMSPGTCRQYCFAVTGLTRYLVDVDVFEDYPLNKVTAPDKNPARMRYENAAADERIVQSARPEMRGLFAFVKATGVDVSVAIDTPAREINLAAGMARLKGTKSAQRDVHDGLIEAWAIPYIRAALSGVMPNVKPWAHLTRFAAYQHHQRCCTKVGIEDYTLKDARHSVAVRMAKLGYTASEIAEQLGNSPDLVATVYARFIVKMAHRDTPQRIEEAK